MGFSRVYPAFAERGLTDDVTFIGSGKLGLPENAAVAFALGVDMMINVAREAMLSIGCIQAQKCHTDKCPTGIATQARGWCAASTRRRSPAGRFRLPAHSAPGVAEDLGRCSASPIRRSSPPPTSTS
ncbi:glutamate synthase-related protein [Streptomyces sp. KL116D]|uniref:glutamate synthase-related protein n=1 Tax=Streptomyces sp. KL116D TaxID=3045152 RepID=UPI0035591981